MKGPRTQMKNTPPPPKKKKKKKQNTKDYKKNQDKGETNQTK